MKPREADPCYGTASGWPVLLDDVDSRRSHARQRVDLNTSSRAWCLSQTELTQQGHVGWGSDRVGVLPDLFWCHTCT